MTAYQQSAKNKAQGDLSPDNVKFSDNSLTVHGTPPWHSSC